MLISKSPRYGRGARIKYDISSETQLLVREHIEIFRTYVSHYLGTVIKYLDERQNVQKKYTIYLKINIRISVNQLFLIIIKNM